MNKLIRKLIGFIFYELNFLELRFYYKTKKYLSKYYNNSNVVIVSEKKTLVYMLDGRAYSGGISDIIKGILSMYKFSKEIGFDFRINFCYPYNLNEYLEPNLYDWNISEIEISYNSNCTAYLWLSNSHETYMKSCEYEEVFQRKILNRFIKNNESKKQFHVYTNSEWTKSKEYALLFNELFKPSKKLGNILDLHKKKLGKGYVSMTFRFQQLLGDFASREGSLDKTGIFLKDLNESFELKKINLPHFGEFQLRAILGDYKNKKISVPLNELEKKILVNKCINKIIELQTNFFPETKILITADSQIFLKAASKLSFVCVISSNKVEEEKAVNKNYKMFLKAFVDVLLLSDAEKLHLLYTKAMYRSGFAKNASFINNKEYEEINF